MTARWMTVEGWPKAHLFRPADRRWVFFWQVCDGDGQIARTHLKPDDGRPRCKRCEAAQRKAKEGKP